MPNERFNVQIGLQYTRGTAVSEALRDVDAILRRVREISQSSRAGEVRVPSFSAATRDAERLRRAIEQVAAAQRSLTEQRGLPAQLPTGAQAFVRPTSGVGSNVQRVAEAALARAQHATAGTYGRLSSELQSLVAAARPDAMTRVQSTGLRLAAAQERLEGALSDEGAAARRAREALIRQATAAAGVGEASQRLQRAMDARAAAERTATERVARGSLAAARQLGVELRRQEAVDRARLAASEADAFLAGQARQGDPLTRPGRAQNAVNTAERRLAAAVDAEATLRRDGARSQSQLIGAANRRIQAEAALVAATQQLADANRREAAASNQGRLAGVRTDFAAGFRGRSDRPYGEQIGQAFKFSILYGTAYRLLSALTQSLQETLSEGIQFQQAMTELKIASGRTVDELEELAGTLGDSAVEAGFAPSQGILAGARSLGLFGVTSAQGGTQAEQDRVAEISARVVSRLATGSDRQPADLQADLAAVAQAFETGVAGQVRAFDLDAYLSRYFGIAPGSTLQAVSESGTVGRAAGFSQEEVTAIAADMISRTGQTPAAVAGFMAQIFSRGGEGTLAGVAGKYGVDTNQVLSEQIAQLAAVYKEAGPSERAEISSAFGRGKVQNAAIALLQDYTTVVKSAEKARSEAGGEGDRAFQERLNNIGGQIALTTGAFKDFASALGDTGLLTVLGATLVAFRELLEGITGVLRIWNQMPDAIKSVLAGLALFGVALRVQAVRGAIGAAAGISRPIPYGGAAAISRGGTLVPIGGGAVGGARVAGTALANMGRAAAAFIGPVGFAILGLAAVGSLYQSARRMKAAQDAATAAMRNYTLVPGVSTAEDYQARASELQTVATQNREATGWLMQAVSFGQANDDNIATAKALEAEAKRMTKVADLLEARAEANPEVAQQITGFDSDSLRSSMDAITASGGTASERMKALRDALLGTADAASQAEAAFDPELFAQEGAGALKAQILDALAGKGPGEGPSLTTYDNVQGASVERKVSGSKLAEQFTGIDPDDLAAATQNALDELGVTSLAGITPETAQAMADIIAADYAKATIHPMYGDEAIGKVQKAINAAIVKYLLAQSKPARQLAQEGGSLTAAQATEVSNLYAQDAATELGALPESAYRDRVKSARRALTRQRETLARTSDTEEIPQLQANINAARRNLAQAQFEEFEALRKVAQQNARGKREVARVGQRFLRKEIAAAVRAGDQDLLVQIIAQAGEGAIAIARQAIREAMRVARQAQAIRAKAMRLALAAEREADVIAGHVFELKDPGGHQAQLDALDSAVHATPEGDVYTTGSDVPGLPAEKLEEEEKETAAQRAAARAAAYAARRGGSLARARADIFAAQVALSEAEKGSVAYYNALGQLFEARNALNDALRDYQHNLALLRIDQTDPVAMANLAVREAARKLREDRNKGKDVRAEDRVALQQAQTEREATVFQTRLEAVQTAENLGRISHAQYIAYLEREHKRLESRKNRTYQQQQQLNQIDQLLQSAAEEMQGQWNFGDIKLPTPYQVRRYIAEQAGDLTNGIGPRATQTTHNEVHISINGADTGVVRRIIDQYVGHTGRTLTPAHRRR